MAQQFQGGHYDYYGPKFFIEADGQFAADMMQDVVEFEYTDNAKKSDQLTLRVANKGFKYKDDARFLAGVRFRLRFGYLSNISDTRIVTIKKARPTFPQSGVPMITLVAFDLRLDVNRTSKPKNWGSVKTSDIAHEIAKEFGFEADIVSSDDARKQARIQPAGIATWKYLLDLADAIDFDCYIEGKVLHFHPKRLSEAPQNEFIYFTDGTGTLLTFDPDVDVGKPPATSKASANTKDGKPGDAKVDEKDKNKGSRMGRYEIQTANQPGATLVPGGTGVQPHMSRMNLGTTKPTAETDKKIVDQQTKALQQKIDLKAIKASMTVVGNPRVRARQNVKIIVPFVTYSGVWRIEESRHVIRPDGDVYTTSCQLQRNAVNKGKPADKNTKNNVNDKNVAPGRRITIQTGNTPGSVGF